MKKVTYRYVVKREYDEFAAMLGSEEDIEQAPHEMDRSEDGIDTFELAKERAMSACLEAVTASPDVQFKAYVYEVGPRGGHLRHWTLDTIGSWAWVGPVMRGRGWT